MKSRIINIVFVFSSWTVFVLAFAWPMVAIIGTWISQGQPPEGGFTFSSRQANLLGRSLRLSTIATVVCLILSLPAAYAVGQVRRLAHRPVWVAMLLLVLLSPPMVNAFGWERIVPATLNAKVRCVGVWALWAWPIPAMLIGSVWAREGRAAYEAALLVTRPVVGFFRISIHSLFAPIALSGLIVFALFFGDYGVPHACGLIVYPTELLGRAQSSSRLIDTAWLSLPCVVVIGLSLAAILMVWRRCSRGEKVVSARPSLSSTSKALNAVAVVGFMVSWLWPIGVLVARLASIDVMAEAFRCYWPDLLCSLGLAVLSGVLAVGVGMVMASARRFQTLGLLWTLAYGALPGALIGESLIAGYNHPLTGWVYDHWPIVALSYIARFGWVGVLTAQLVLTLCPSDVVAQARTDGANQGRIVSHIHFAMNWPVLLCGVAVIAALSLADVAGSSLVRVPSFTPIAHVLMEKFHRFENGMLISLSLWLVAAALIPALALAMILRSRGKR